MIGRLFRAFTLALWLSGCAVLLCKAQSSALEPKAAACNPLCRDGLVCRVSDDKAQCVPPLSCAAVLCVAGSTCIENNGDVTCVRQDKPGRPNKDNNSTDQCFDDASCTGDQKCCAGICRKECKMPINPCAVVRCGFNTACLVLNGLATCQSRVRPGFCPFTLNPFDCPLLPLPNKCEDDSVCTSGEKCCKNRCGASECRAAQPVCTSGFCTSTDGASVCVEVTTTSQQTTNVSPKCSAPSSNNDYCSDGSNTCNAGQTCLRTRLCPDESDTDCFPAVTCSDQTDQNPCDSTVCGPNQKCVVLESVSLQARCVDNSLGAKPGQCPTLPPGTVGICIAGCENDNNCAGDQKCCSNGCGHMCQAPAERTKPGECPTLPPGTIGTCVEACTNDFNCTGDSKCCSNGCGHVCKPSAKSATTPITPTKSTTPVSTITLAPPTCAGVKCPYGQCCQQQTIFCVRAPCPQPPPSCVNCQSTSTSTPITTTSKTGKTKY